MKITKLKVKTKVKNYNIFVGYNIIDKLPSILKSENIKFDKCLIVIDKNIPPNKFKVLKKKIKCKKKILFL